MDVRGERELYLLHDVLDNQERREHHRLRGYGGFVSDGAQKLVHGILRLVRCLVRFADEVGRSRDGLRLLFGNVVGRDAQEGFLRELAEADLRSDTVLVVVCETAEHRSQVFEARMDALLFAQEVAFPFEALLLGDVLLQPDDLVRLLFRDNRDELLVVNEYGLVVEDEVVGFVFGNLFVTVVFVGGADVRNAAVARLLFAVRDGLGIVRRLNEVSAVLDVHDVLRCVHALFVLGPELEWERVDERRTKVALFLEFLFGVVEAVLVADEVLLVVGELAVERLDALLVEQRVRLVAQEQEPHVRGERGAVLEQRYAEGMQLVVDLHLHVFHEDFVFEFQVRNEIADVVHLHFAIRLAEQELRGGVARADLAVGLEREYAVAQLVKQALHEPVRTFVLERNRCEILPAQNGEEYRGVLVPLQEYGVSSVDVEVAGNRYDEVEEERQHGKEDEGPCHVEVYLRRILVTCL